MEPCNATDKRAQFREHNPGDFRCSSVISSPTIGTNTSVCHQSGSSNSCRFDRRSLSFECPQETVNEIFSDIFQESAEIPVESPVAFVLTTDKLLQQTAHLQNQDPNATSNGYVKRITDTVLKSSVTRVV